MTQLKTALITGAAKRIGRALALDLGAAGWSVAVHYHNARADAEQIAEEIRSKGGRATVLDGDLSAPETPGKLLRAAAEELGPLTCLINNASRFESDEVANLTCEGWDAHININLRAPAFLSQAFAAQLPASQHGNIINMIDQRVWKLTPQFFSYTVSKAALWDMTRTLAQALAPKIRVNAIGPGPALINARQTQIDFDRQSAATILGRGTNPEEICAAVRYILAAPAMTGQMIALDGGQHLAWQTPDIVGIKE